MTPTCSRSGFEVLRCGSTSQHMQRRKTKGTGTIAVVWGRRLCRGPSDSGYLSLTPFFKADHLPLLFFLLDSVLSRFCDPFHRNLISAVWSHGLTSPLTFKCLLALMPRARHPPALLPVSPSRVFREQASSFAVSLPRCQLIPSYPATAIGCFSLWDSNEWNLHGSSFL